MMGRTSKIEGDIKSIEELLEKLRKMLEKMREIMEEESTKSNGDSQSFSGLVGGGQGITFLLLVIIVIFFVFDIH